MLSKVTDIPAIVPVSFSYRNTTFVIDFFEGIAFGTDIFVYYVLHMSSVHRVLCRFFGSKTARSSHVQPHPFDPWVVFASETQRLIGASLLSKFDQFQNMNDVSSIITAGTRSFLRGGPPAGWNDDRSQDERQERTSVPGEARAKVRCPQRRLPRWRHCKRGSWSVRIVRRVHVGFVEFRCVICWCSLWFSWCALWRCLVAGLCGARAAGWFWLAHRTWCSERGSLRLTPVSVLVDTITVIKAEVTSNYGVGGPLFMPFYALAFGDEFAHAGELVLITLTLGAAILGTRWCVVSVLTLKLRSEEMVAVLTICRCRVLLLGSAPGCLWHSLFPLTGDVDMVAPQSPWFWCSHVHCQMWHPLRLARGHEGFQKKQSLKATYLRSFSSCPRGVTSAWPLRTTWGRWRTMARSFHWTTLVLWWRDAVGGPTARPPHRLHHGILSPDNVYLCRGSQKPKSDRRSRILHLRARTHQRARSVPQTRFSTSHLLNWWQSGSPARIRAEIPKPQLLCPPSLVDLTPTCASWSSMFTVQLDHADLGWRSRLHWVGFGCLSRCLGEGGERGVTTSPKPTSLLFFFSFFFFSFFHFFSSFFLFLILWIFFFFFFRFFFFFFLFSVFFFFFFLLFFFPFFFFSLFSMFFLLFFIFWFFGCFFFLGGGGGGVWCFFDCSIFV